MLFSWPHAARTEIPAQPQIRCVLFISESALTHPCPTPQLIDKHEAGAKKIHTARPHSAHAFFCQAKLYPLPLPHSRTEQLRPPHPSRRSKVNAQSPTQLKRTLLQAPGRDCRILCLLGLLSDTVPKSVYPGHCFLYLRTRELSQDYSAEVQYKRTVWALQLGTSGTHWPPERTAPLSPVHSV